MHSTDSLQISFRNPSDYIYRLQPDEEKFSSFQVDAHGTTALYFSIRYFKEGGSFHWDSPWIREQVLGDVAELEGLGAAVFSPTFVYATSANIPLMINIQGTIPNLSSLKVNSAEIYLNTTDSHYHVRGTVTNMLHESKDISTVTGVFTNKSTGHLLSSVVGPMTIPIGPRKTVGYDFDTSYTPAQLAQFRSMKLEVNAS